MRGWDALGLTRYHLQWRIVPLPHKSEVLAEVKLLEHHQRRLDSSNESLAAAPGRI